MVRARPAEHLTVSAVVVGGAVEMDPDRERAVMAEKAGEDLGGRQRGAQGDIGQRGRVEVDRLPGGGVHVVAHLDHHTDALGWQVTERELVGSVGRLEMDLAGGGENWRGEVAQGAVLRVAEGQVDQAQEQAHVAGGRRAGLVEVGGVGRVGEVD